MLVRTKWYAVILFFVLCLASFGKFCDGDPNVIDGLKHQTVNGLTTSQNRNILIKDAIKNSNATRSRRFIVFGGDGVPEYGDGGVDHDAGPYDYDDWYDDVGDDDDDDDDYEHDHGNDPGYHHVWWHHFYHHGEPHLPFPLFPPFVVHRLRPVYRGCDQWPFVCRSTYEVIQWLQCYHEFISRTHANHDYPDAGGVLNLWKK